MRSKIFSISLLVAISAFIGGCSSFKVKSDVDSLARTDAAQKKNYLVMPGLRGVQETDLQYQEFVTYVDAVLQERGLIKVTSTDDADILIFFSYSMGDPQVNQYTYSTPIFGQTGVSSASTYGNVSSTGAFSATTTYTPTYGVTGSAIQTKREVLYTRMVQLEAMDVPTYRADKKLVQVWKTSVISTGTSGDLRLVMPFLVAAMKPYVGTNISRRITVEISEKDKSLKALRALHPQPDDD